MNNDELRCVVCAKAPATTRSKLCESFVLCSAQACRRFADELVAFVRAEQPQALVERGVSDDLIGYLLLEAPGTLLLYVMQYASERPRAAREFFANDPLLSYLVQDEASLRGVRDLLSGAGQLQRWVQTVQRTRGSRGAMLREFAATDPVLLRFVLLTSRPQLTAGDFVAALGDAVRVRNLRSVESLVSALLEDEGAVRALEEREAQLKDLFTVAVRGGNPEIVAALARVTPELRTRSRTVDELLQAMQRGNLPLARVLYSTLEGGTLLDERAGQLLRAAAESGAVDVLSRLVNNRRIELRGEDLRAAFEQALTARQIGAVAVLLPRQPSKVDRVRLLRRVLETGRRELVLALLEADEFQLSQREANTLVTRLVEDNDAAALEILTRSEWSTRYQQLFDPAAALSNTALRRVFESQNALAVAFVLLLDLRVVEKMRASVATQAFFTALARNNRAANLELLMNGELSPDAPRVGQFLATFPKYAGVVLPPNYRVPPPRESLATVFNAARPGSESYNIILRYLQQNEPGVI